MNAVDNVPVPGFPPTFLHEAPPAGGDLDTLRQVLAVVLYAAALAGILYYLIRKLPRAGAAGAEGPSLQGPGTSDKRKPR